MTPRTDTRSKPVISEKSARRIRINGIVQGVGFRPFVFKLAKKYHLCGEVSNTASGVSIHAEGYPADIEQFCEDLSNNSPPLSRITECSVFQSQVNGYQSFRIVESKTDEKKHTLISPDVSICPDCLKELFDRQDRRYRYPFINCTNCGPRYTIIDDIPYDRPNTSMKHFPMCESCLQEYQDPEDRRFHAQPNACQACGPHVELFKNTGEQVKTSSPIQTAVRLIKEGAVIAIKGLGGFHLAADGENEEAVTKLRQRKHREQKPLALMALDEISINRFAKIKPSEHHLLTSVQRPIVLLEKQTPNTIAASVSPKNRYFGVMLPYTPLHYLLLSDSRITALVMTSGNMSEEPIAIDNHEAFSRLGAIADYLLLHNRDIYLRSDDSIVCHVAGATRFIRRSRGYVPMPVFLKHPAASVLGCGAELKNTVCLVKGNQAFLSQHIGDMENLSTFEFFEMTIGHVKRILNIEPEVIACDLHPDYLSTRWASSQASPILQIQHHFAHIVSCLAENHEEGPVIGLSFDGTGYGEDGHIWGGEVLIADLAQYSRVAHLEYIPMPGGAAAIKAPWRMAASYLYHAYGESFFDLDLPMIRNVEHNKLQIITQMIHKAVNSPLTSSVGRFFDGISAILGLRDRVGFEGQAAMELEMLASKDIEDFYPFFWNEDAPRKILLEPIIKGVVSDILKGADPPVIAGKFHNTIIRMFTELCVVFRKENSLNTVALSGGVFQNRILLNGLIKALTIQGFKVLSHTLVPANDGGISLGQAVAAAHQIRKEKVSSSP